MSLSEEDVRLITLYVSTLDPDDALAYIESNDCLAEQAWLHAVAERAAVTWTIDIMTAYAHAKGDLTSFVLTLPSKDDNVQ